MRFSKKVSFRFQEISSIVIKKQSDLRSKVKVIAMFFFTSQYPFTILSSAHNFKNFMQTIWYTFCYVHEKFCVFIHSFICLILIFFCFDIEGIHFISIHEMYSPKKRKSSKSRTSLIIWRGDCVSCLYRLGYKIVIKLEYDTHFGAARE